MLCAGCRDGVPAVLLPWSLLPWVWVPGGLSQSPDLVWTHTPNRGLHWGLWFQCDAGELRELYARHGAKGEPAEQRKRR